MEKRHLVMLFVLVVLLYNPVLLVLPYVPQTGNDGRAHIARIMCFPWCIIWGDVDPRFYFGEAYTVYYGVLFYAIASPAYITLKPVLGAAYAAALAYKLGCLLVDFMIVLFALRLCSRGSRLTASILTLLLPPVLYARLAGAYPYMLSAILVLHASLDLLEGRVRRALLLSSLAILAHPYGVVNTAVLLVWAYREKLLMLDRGLALLIPPLIPLAHGVVTLGRYSAPLVELAPLTLAYALLLIAMPAKTPLSRLSRLYEVVALAAAAINTSVAMGVAPPEAAKLISWRFVFVNATVLRYAEAIDSVATRLSRLGVGAAVFTAALILTHNALLLYEPIPDYSVLRGERILATIDVTTDYSSPIAWPHAYSYTCATGGFHQGDPLFTNITVFYEWVESLAKNPRIAHNLALISGAGVIDTTSLAGYKPLLCIEARRLLIPPAAVTLMRHCLYRVANSTLVYLVKPLALDLKRHDPLAFTQLVRIYGDARIVFVRRGTPMVNGMVCDYPGCGVSVCRAGCTIQLDLDSILAEAPRRVFTSPLDARMFQPPKSLVEAAKKIAYAVASRFNPVYEPIPAQLHDDKLVFNATRPGWYLVLAAPQLIEGLSGPIDYKTSTVEGLLLIHVSRPGLVVVDYGVAGRREAYTAMIAAYAVTTLIAFSRQRRED